MSRVLSDSVSPDDHQRCLWGPVTCHTMAIMMARYPSPITELLGFCCHKSVTQSSLSFIVYFGGFACLTLGHTGYVSLLWPTGGMKPSWVTVSVVHEPLEGAIVYYIPWLGAPNNIDGGPYSSRTLATSSATASVGMHPTHTFTMFFTSQGHNSTSPSLYPTNNAVEYMLDAQMPRRDRNILVMCSTEDVHDFQNRNKHEKLMAQSCVAWYMLCATVHGPANNSLVCGHLLQMELETQTTQGKKLHSGASRRFEHGCSGVFISLDSPTSCRQWTSGLGDRWDAQIMPVREDAPAAPGEAAAAAADAAQTAANTFTNAVASGSGSAAANNNKNSVLKKRKVGKIVNKAPHRRMRSATPALT
ncbi:hypothetical protein B0H17DRAFT_1148113 [Mycena rosella]|uniref:Uncharacterized protein n=1 Tax=Mycena rosella TaxID=1033263 RepID=A0AAD7FXE8_MYCRO|nr:hypothetical protein B0H17DRAFT_1148113 [Mycena rosella]